MTEPRLPFIPPEDRTAEQAQTVAEFLDVRKVEPSGPFVTMLHSPAVLSLARSMGDYLRFKSGIGTTLSELVILITAREWSQDFEWYFHAPIAEKMGIKPQTIADIREGRRPTTMSEDEEIVYDVSIELHRYKRVSDASFARAEARFGKSGVVDLIAVNGYYTFLAMQLNAAAFRIPEDGTPLPRFPF
jgi:4-carboxymuconolactone decarboxylase